ncbi:30S ribosomal protein S10 [Candidatus Hodgkinia cicadicola]
MILWIRAKAYSKVPLDDFVEKVLVAFGFGGNFLVRGPTYLPTKVKKFTVNKSPHIDKKSRDQLEIRTHNRLIIISGAYRVVMSKVLAMELPKGLFIEMTPILAKPRDARYCSGKTQFKPMKWR